MPAIYNSKYETQWGANDAIAYTRVASGEWEIDDDGRIWRIAIRKPWSVLYPCERRRAEELNKKGYFYVRPYIDGAIRRAYAHRIVWLHFFGPIPDGWTVNHKSISRDTTDNRPSNLELATMSEQHLHAYRVMNRRPPNTKGTPRKLTAEKVAEIREKRLNGARCVRLAEEYGVDRQTIYRIVKHTSWK